MVKALVLVQNEDYARSNCYVHQLLKQLESNSEITIASIHNYKQFNPSSYARNIILLQQRKLYQQIQNISVWYADVAVTIYDQDPWEAFRDGNNTKNAYDVFVKKLRIEQICVPSPWWQQLMIKRGLPAKFVRIWTLPEYCSDENHTFDRLHKTAFLGTVHSYRKPLLDACQDLRVPVYVNNHIQPYPQFLDMLSQVGVYIYSANNPVVVDGNNYDLRQSLWAKDVEAFARGCFVIREHSCDATAFIGAMLKTHLMFKSFDEIPELINSVFSMHPDDVRQAQTEAVSYIRHANYWQETAAVLLGQLS